MPHVGCRIGFVDCRHRSSARTERLLVLFRGQPVARIFLLRARDRAAACSLGCAIVDARFGALLPPDIARAVMQALGEAAEKACYFEIDSDLGHSSSGPEHAKWSPVLREFLAPLIVQSA